MKKASKALSVALALAAIIVCLASVPLTDGEDVLAQTGDSAEIFASGSGTETDPFIIENVDQLEAFRDSVNAGNAYEGQFIKLSDDIYALELEAGWVPIGYSARTTTVTEDTRVFSGSFDGNDKTIYGLDSTGYVPGSESLSGNEFVYGFFGFLYNATIKNLTLNEVNIDIDRIETDSGELLGDTVGALAGYALGDVTIDKNTILGQVTGYNAVAGVVARSYGNSITITDCLSMADITATDAEGGKAGGIIAIISTGNTSSTVSGCETASYTDEPITVSAIHVGGILGFSGDGQVTIDNCTTNNTIVSSPVPSKDNVRAFAGGIVGNGNITTIEECYTLDSEISTAHNAGGALGGSGGSSCVININGCLVQDSSISSENRAGGLVGYLLAKTVNISGYNYQPTLNRITVSVTSEAGDNYVGGIIGYYAEGNEKGSFTIEDIVFGDNIVLNVANENVVSGNHIYGDVRGSAIGYILSSSVVTVRNVSDLADYELIAQASVTGDVVIADCVTTKPIMWGKTSSVTNLKLENTQLAGFIRDFGYITIYADESSRIVSLVAGDQDNLDYAIANGLNIDSVSAAVDFRIAGGQTLNVGTVYLYPETPLDGKTYSYRGEITGSEGSILQIEQSGDGDDYMLAGSYKWNANTEAWDAPSIEMNGNQYYHTLQEAIDADNYVDITLIDDVVVYDGPIIVSAEKEVYIDLNGHTITVDPGYAGVDIFQNHGSLAFEVSMVDDQVIEGGAIDATAALGTNIINNAGMLNIFAGTFKTSGEGHVLINSDNAFISDGEFQSASTIISPNGGTVTISGGVFNTESANAFSAGGEGAIRVAGGQFNTTVSSDLLQEGYIQNPDGQIVYNGTGQNIVASVSGIHYTDFYEALDVAQNGLALYLEQDFTIEQPVTIGGITTIHTNGHVLTLGDGGSLTVTKNLYLTGLTDPSHQGSVVCTESGQLIAKEGGVLQLSTDILYDPSDKAAEERVLVTLYGETVQGTTSDYYTQVVIHDDAYLTSTVENTIAIYIDCIDGQYSYGSNVNISGTFGENVTVPVSLNPSLTSTEGNVPQIDFNDGWGVAENVKVSINTDGYARWFFNSGDFVNSVDLNITKGDITIYGGTWPSGMGYEDYVYETLIIVENNGSFTLAEGTLIIFEGYGLEGVQMKIPRYSSVTGSGVPLPSELNGVAGVYGYKMYYYGEPWDQSMTYDGIRVYINAIRDYVSYIVMDPATPYEGDTAELSLNITLEEGFLIAYSWYLVDEGGVPSLIDERQTTGVTESGTYLVEVDIIDDNNAYVGGSTAQIEVVFAEPVYHQVTVTYPNALDWEDSVLSVRHNATIDTSEITVPEGYVFNGFTSLEVEGKPVTADMTVEAVIGFTSPSLNYTVDDNMDGSATITIESGHILDNIGLNYKYLVVDMADFDSENPPVPSDSNVFEISESGTYTFAVYLIHPDDENIFGESVLMNEFNVTFPEAPAEGVGYTIKYGPDQATITADEGYYLSDDDENGSTIYAGPGDSFRVQVDSANGNVYMSPPTIVQMPERPVTPETVDIDVSYRDIAVSTGGIEIRLSDSEWGTTITGLEPDTEYSIEYRLEATDTFAGDTKTVTVTTTALGVPEAPSEGEGYTAEIGEETAQILPASGYEITLDMESPGTDAITVNPDQTFYVRLAATDTETASAWTENAITKPAAPGNVSYSVSTNTIVAGPGFEMIFLDNGTWTKTWVDEITVPSPNTDYTVKFRLAATDSTFASYEVEMTVKTEVEPEPELTTPDAPEVGVGFTIMYSPNEATVTAMEGYQLSYDGDATSNAYLVLEPEKTFYVRLAPTETSNASDWTANSTPGRVETTTDVRIDITPTTITVGTTGMEFRVGDGDWTTETVTGLTPEMVYRVEYRYACDGEGFAGTTVSLEVTTLALYVPEAPPEGYGFTAVFDEDTVTITPMEMFEISSDGESVAESLTLGPGGTFKVRVAAGGEYTHSDWTDVTVPERPQALGNPNITAGRTSISVSDAGIEIRIEGGEWTTSITGLSSGTSYTVQYRLAATETSFAGIVGEVTVSTTSSSGGGGGGGGTTPTPDPEPEEDTETVTNPDGSSTTTTTRPDGSSTVTTERPDGSSTTTDTKPVTGGTQTTVTETDTDGNTTSTTTTETETTTSTGSTVTSTTVEKTDADGNTTSTTESTYTSEDESTVTQVTVTTDADGNRTAQTNTTVTVAPSDEGTATVPTDAIAEAVNQIGDATSDVQEAEKVITVQPSGDTTQNVQVVIEPEAIRHVADADAQLEIAGDVGTIKASTDVATSLSQRESPVSMSISLADKTQMAPVIQSIVGDRPTYQLTASSGEDSIHELGGDVTVTIPYTLSEGEDPESIVVFYVDDDGILHAMPTSYENGVVSFTTNHFSYYTIQSEIAAPEPETSDDGGDNTLYYVAAAVIAIVVIAAIAVFMRHKV